MAGKWFPLLMLLGIALIVANALLTARRGVIGILFLDFRRDEGPTEFWAALTVMTVGAVGLLYVLLR